MKNAPMTVWKWARTLASIWFLAQGVLCLVYDFYDIPVEPTWAWGAGAYLAMALLLRPAWWLEDE